MPGAVLQATALHIHGPTPPQWCISGSAVIFGHTHHFRLTMAQPKIKPGT
jgi:hypothetical protein